jgi:hypothetical protein
MMDLKHTGCDGVELLLLAHYRDHCRALVNTVMNLRVPLAE